MSELRLDYQDNPPFPWAGVALLGVALITLVLAGTYFFKLNSQVADWELRIKRTKTEGTQSRLVSRSSEHSSADLIQEVNSANDALRHLTVPWESLFHAVESSGSTNITLLAIEPDIEKQQVKISGEAKDFSSLMSYITHLQGQVVLGSVYLQNHDVQQEDPDKPVRFNLLADWLEKS